MKVNKIQQNKIISFRNSSETTEAKKTDNIKKDSIEINKKPEPPKISFIRALFSVLNDEQIDELNKSRKLPENCKFVFNGAGGYTITPNVLNLSLGTRTLPGDFEVKKNVLGFALVVPKDADSILIKKRPEKNDA